MKYKRIAVYYWSGTGNSLRVAKWIGEEASNNGLSGILSSIHLSNPEEELLDSSETLLGIVLPAHGFTAPWPVIKFCARLPRRKHCHAIVVSTKGATYPEFYLPGLACSANWVILLLLFLKGFKVRGVRSLDMPVNWISLVQGLKEKHAHHFIKQSKEKSHQFMQCIFSGKTFFLSTNNMLELTVGLILLPVSLLYIIIGRLFLAKLFFANKNCNSCEICQKNCPHQAIKMKGTEKRPYWTFKCESCMRCMNYCPKRAIEAGHSIALIFIFLTSFSLSSLYLPELIRLFPWVGIIDNELVKLILDIPIYIAAFFIIYWIIFHLMRVPFINQVFTYTTLTHWYRRYHDDKTSLANFREPELIRPTNEILKQPERVVKE